tara:strand:- start:158 stop:823 length:666 start_codon:yes stop_codon:yes gene_type:complete
MAFPPQFSSTATYANRYDLDELDVFLEGNSTNPMFFNVSGLPERLAFGKHYFYLSILDSTNQQYRLRPNSRILFEFKSMNNVVLRSDVESESQSNGVATCFVEVLQDPLRTTKEVKDGNGTLTIVGSLENTELTQNPIPEKFLGAVNYRCTFPIEIRKNILNADSPFVLNTEHKKTTNQGQFLFSKASFGAPKGSQKGLVFDEDTLLPIDFPDDVVEEDLS